MLVSDKYVCQKAHFSEEDKALKNKRLSVILIALIILSLVLPAASFAAPEANKSFVSKLGDVNYKFDINKIVNQKVTREKDASKEGQSKHHKVEGSQSVTIERDGSMQMPAQSAAQPATNNIEPQNYVPASDSSTTISVIVELHAEPLAPFNAKVKQGLMKANVNQKSIIDREQASFKTALSKSVNAKIHRTYEQVFNGFALEIAANKVDQLLKLPGVKAVYPDNEVVATAIDKEGVLNNYVPMMDRSAPHIGADHLWNQGITGTGIKVGVLDTGIDYLHPDLAAAYKGGWDFVDNDNDPYETTPIDWQNAPPGTPPQDADGRNYWTDHGSHVSGIIAGRGIADGGTKGVAPGADIYAYRVLGPYGSGSNSGVIAAIERSVIDGMDVINLSLGSKSNNQYAADSVALNNTMLAGVVVAVSAGNSGPNDGTLTDPATSEMAISVGNSFPPTQVPSISAVGLPTITGNMMEFTPNYEEGQLEVVYVGLGKPGDFTGKDVTGKIALIQRGEISFREKSVNAQAAGAAVAIIFNNAVGNLNGTMGEPGNYIPTFSLSQADGLLLKNKYDAEGAFTAQLGYVLEVDYMNDGSSRGPARPGYDIKPDVAAPGTGIVSTIAAYGRDIPDADYSDAYAAFTGTSMAAPHIAGAAALLLDKHSGLSAFDVKSLIMNNAHKISDRNGNRYRHMDQGAGRVDLASSAVAKAVALVHETTDAVKSGSVTAYETGSLSFGYVGAGESVSKTITVKDIVGESSSYTISSKWYGNAGGSISTSTNQVAVGANGSSDFTLTLSVPANTTQSYYEGELVLTEAGGHELQLPIGFYVGVPVVVDPVTEFKITPDIFSPNGDGEQDTSTITFALNEPAGYLSLDVYTWDIDWEGLVVETANLGPGRYRVADWNGVIDLWGLGIPYLLSDDIYIMVPWFGASAGSAEPIVEALTPFIVDKIAPSSSLNEPEIVVDSGSRKGMISGTIDGDLLIDLIDEDILLNSISELFGAGVLYEENGEWVQVDGDVDDEGNFSIEVPLQEGDNRFEVYIYDAAGNGVVEPAHIVNYYFEDEGGSDSVNIIANPSADQVEVGKPFAVAVDFSNVDDLYAAQFSLSYDASLNKGTVSPSTELSEYQSSNNGSGLIVNEKVVDLGNGKLRSDYLITLAGDFAGFNGSGSLATYNFSSDTIGEYNFALSDVRLLNSDGEDIKLGNITGATVRVTEISKPEFTISGNIAAEAFGENVDYSATWYTGDDGVHKVIVEAVDGNGAIVGLGTVNANGSYSIKVGTAGQYTIRVVVPGHFSAESSIMVDGNKTINFGPLSAGDVNSDGVVDLVDLQQAAKAYGKTTGSFDYKSAAADINRDGSVDMLDISYILNNYGKRK